MLLTGASAAQDDLGGQVGGGPWDPTVDGQWAGPYDLSEIMTENVDAGGNALNKEIAHSAVLPPSWYEPPPGVTAPDHAGMVVFWNRKKAMDWDPEYPTWRWDPDRPQGLLPSWPVSGDSTSDPFSGDDIFCSGMAFLPSGDLLTVGGYEATSGGTGSPIGLDRAFVLRVSGAGATGWDGNPFWSHEHANGLAFTRMDTIRYYPTATALPSGGVLALGGVSFQGRSRQLFRNPWDGMTGGFTEIGFESLTDRTNQVIDDPVAPPDPCMEPVLNVHDYPKAFVLKDGRVMYSDGVVRLTSPALGDYHVSYFFDPEAIGDCATEPENPRWAMGVPDLVTDPHLVSGEPIKPVMFGGSGVYLITRSDVGNELPNTTDVVYLMGGTTHHNDDQACTDANVPITDVARKMVTPSETATWEQSSVPDMQRQRLNGVATILLDGSILVTGGTSKQDPMGDDGTCTYAMRPERYRPPEVFHDVSTVPAENPWRLMAKAGHRRTYHNTAGLLPDGRVYVSGSQHGQALSDEHDSRYSVELFSPPYMFVGPRPEVLDPPDAPVHMGDVAELTVRLGSSDRRIERIAMLRNSSTTHAFDMNQRYVEVEFAQAPIQDPSDTQVWTVFIIWPGSGLVGNDPQDIMVPGWHLLTVVDAPVDPLPAWDCGGAEPTSTSCTQRPSEAVWVQLLPPMTSGN